MNSPIKTVLILGAECTGKSTLSQALAKRYNTSHMNEYMRTYLEQKGDGYICTYDDLTPIAQGQMDGENNAIQQATTYCFIDTSLLLLDIYSRHYFNKSPAIITDNLHRPYDVILLTDEIGIDWVADGMRDLPNGRKAMRQKIIDQLTKYNLPYYPISGDLSNRIRQVERILYDNFGK